MPESQPLSQKKYRVAFSFAGEKREFVAQVARLLANCFGETSILYDHYHKAQFARPNLGFYLPPLYLENSDLIVAVLCPDYQHKEWCGLEWRAIFDLIAKGETEKVMLARFDRATVEGIFLTDGFIELDQSTPAEFAKLVLQRLAENEGRDRDAYLHLLKDSTRSGDETTEGEAGGQAVHPPADTSPVVSQRPVPPAQRVIDSDAERCVVAVRVDGSVVGAGIVVGRGVVVTCAHLVLPNGQSPRDLPNSTRLEIEFLALVGTGTQSVQKVVLDQQCFSPPSRANVAFLNWSGEIPEGVTPARWAVGRKLLGRRCSTLGLARSRQIRVVRETREVLDGAVPPDVSPLPTLPEPSSPAEEHSGGPLFDGDTGDILGLVGELTHPRGAQAKRVSIVSGDAIFRVAPALFATELRLLDTAADLQASLVDSLRQSPRVHQEVARALKWGGLDTPDSQTAVKLADALLSAPPQDVVKGLARVDSQLRTGPQPDPKASQILVELYLKLMPAVVHQKSQPVVRLVLEQVTGVHQGPVLVPTSSKTILALYLAAADGVAVRLDRGAAREERNENDHVIEDIPESGFQNGEVNQSVVIKHLIQRLGGLSEASGAETWSETDLIAEVNSRLQALHAQRRTKGIVIGRKLTPEQEQILRETLKCLAIVRLTGGRGDHREWLNPFIIDNFPLPS